MQFRDILLIGGLFAAFALAARLGLAEALGAHPWWAIRTGVIGSLIGAGGLVLLRWAGVTTRTLAELSGTCLVLASTAAVLGKRAFAASFAESTLAGRFWYFGWFAIAASLFVLVAALILHRLRR